jgi:drug/metabolite transporter (DMT)-like permease
MKEDRTRLVACCLLVLALTAILIAYASAFLPTGTPDWAPWLLALGIPVSLGAIMILGAARGKQGVGPLKIPFAFVIVTLAMGFCAVLILPASESPTSTLWLGLPARAAIVIYGIGLLPIIVLPVAYALTFESQTLTAEDIERVRSLSREIAKRNRTVSAAVDSPS